MKHFRFFIAAILLAIINGPAYSQILKPKDVATSAATNQVNSTETSTIDNGVNKTADAIKGLFKKKKKAEPAQTPANTPAVLPQPVPVSAVTPALPIPTGSISAYNNYDFVPGDQVVFFDDFNDDQAGEFPSSWNLAAGQAVINTVAGKKAFLLTDGNYAKVSPRIKSVSYLNDPFTIEFDTYSNGGYPPQIYFYNTTADVANSDNHVGTLKIEASDLQITSTTGVQLSGSYPESIAGDNFINKWNHIAIAFKKGQLKVYVNQYRVLVVPNWGITPHAIDIEGIGDNNTPIMIANYRIANGGGMNMLGKKFTDAKIVTHGINFDTGQATIKPESMGTLNMISGILKDNPDLKFEIDGHTDNSGTTLGNITLSQQRADAVKTQLLSMGIDASRLSTRGYGDTRPISDNSSAEGKANNRRVEFVKK